MFEQKNNVRNILQMYWIDYERCFLDICFYFGLYRKNFSINFLASDVIEQDGCSV